MRSRTSGRRSAAQRQAGFTLTELLVVVAIVGVLVTMAIVYMRPRIRPIDVATRIGDLVREGNRRAVALGPVRAEVAVALGSKARTQIVGSRQGANIVFTLFRLEEAPQPAVNGVWLPIEFYVVDAKVNAVQWAPDVGDQTMPGLTADWDTFVTQCRPDGTCDPRTLFFQSAIPVPAYEELAKMSIMQLGGAINLRTDWN
jgi:prepilin-type N-terminal cleavage/methylation domain-containing protein